MIRKNRSWSDFERRIFRDCYIMGHVIVKIPEKFIGVYSGTPKQEKTPFDFFCAIHGKALVFDAKQTAKPRFMFSEHITNPKKKHQFEALLDAHHKNCASGYLVHFTELDSIAWIHTRLIIERMNAGEKSIDPFGKDFPHTCLQSYDICLDIKKLTAQPSS